VLVPPQGRLSDQEAQAARLAVPYLGPDPAPSVVAGKVAIGFLIVGIISRLAAALVFVQRASLDRQVADQLNRRATGQAFDPQALYTASSALTDNRHTTAMISITYLLVLLGITVSFFIWRAQRRPKAVLEAFGETHVESPLRWVRTRAYRSLLGGLIVASLLIGFQGSVTVNTTAADVAGKRMWSAVACLGWACVWVLQILLVRASERAHADRLAASSAQRAGEVPVPVFAPLPRADQSAQVGESEGALWILRSAGLFMVGLISGFVLIAAIGEHSMEVVPYAAVAAPIFGLVVWAYVRRFQRKAERRAAGTQPQVTLTGYQ